MTGKLRVSLQKAIQAQGLPSRAQFSRWVAAALEGRRAMAEVAIRLVDEEESRALNRSWRNQDYPTNVLSFPAGLPDGVPLPLLGDLVMCAPLVAREAAEQGKSPAAHWAHLTVHGSLHLLGYDHESEAQAAVMEPLETAILRTLGFPDPYAQDR
ncbi:MAG: rRNA maturation RNase YbeY [Gammaproteobacteria bacterium]|nr:rRNA maturation RNase YbeY [Gammaproteobacteria bacterium]